MWSLFRRAARRPSSVGRSPGAFHPRVEALEERTLLTAGALDPTFGTSGTILNTFRQGDLGTEAGVRALLVYPDADTHGNAGKVLAVGLLSLPSTNTTERDFALFRYHPDGTPDTTFGTNGVVTTDIAGHTDIAYGAALDAAGRVVVAGYAYHPISATATAATFAVARYTPDGSLDSDPVSGFGPVDSATGRHAGKLTTVFLTGGSTARAVAVQPDGKIVVGGYAYNGSNDDFALVRYLADGSLDASFGSGGRVATPIGPGLDQARALVLQADGKILLAGSAFNGKDRDFALVRYQSNGTLDGSFGTGGKVTTPIGVTVLGKNKKVIVVPEDEAAGLALDAAGRPVLAGYTTGTSGARNAALVRYTTAGRLDTTFGGTGKVVTDLGGSDEGRTVAIQPDGKLVLAGKAYAGSTTGYDFVLARYTAAGALDTSFGASGKVLTALAAGTTEDVAIALALQADGRIVAGGYASPGVALARYLGDPPAAPTGLTAVAVSASQVNLTWTGAATPITGYVIERSTDGVSFTSVGMVDAALTLFSDTELSPGTQYYYRIRAYSPNGSSPYSLIVQASTLAS